MNRFNFPATAIGSLGHTDPKEATSFILNTLTDIPCWAQMPQRSFKENMYAQFSEGIPGIVIEEQQRRIFVDAGGLRDEEMAYVYERYIAGDIDGFGMSREYAAGFYEFLTQLQEKNIRPIYLKGQITGPVSFLLTVTDEDKKPLLYQGAIADCVLKVLTMKARWQVRELKKISARIIIFVDEPYLVSLGSGYVNLDRRDALSYINEITDAIHQEGALAGIHCCGNTDWEFLTQTRTDIINFDAYNFSGSLALYPGAIRRFLEKDGVIAWGIAPTTPDAEKIGLEELVEKLKASIELLTTKGVDRELVYRHSLITPSCGLGSLSPATGEHILKTTQRISEECNKGQKGSDPFCPKGV